MCRLAEALYRVGDTAEAERVAQRGLAATSDPDLLVDLHWTLAQCRTMAGRFPESLATLNQALALPGISGRHRARLLVAIARTHRELGQIEMAEQVASAALAEATEADDDWAVGWALHVLTYAAAMRGRMTDALPLYDRALAVTQAEPALTDLRLLLQINKAVTLGDLDQYDGAFAAAREAQQLADRVGIMVRRAQAHCCSRRVAVPHRPLGRRPDRGRRGPGSHQGPRRGLLRPRGRRGDLLSTGVTSSSARDHLAAAAPHAERIGNRVVGTLALARSEAFEQEGALTEALGVLTGFTDDAEEVDEVEDLLADGVRLATKVGDTAAAQDPRRPGRGPGQRLGDPAPAGQRALLPGPGRSRRRPGCSGPRNATTTPGGRCWARRRWRPRPERSSDQGDRDPARAAFSRAVDLYTSLGATRDVARLQARFRAHGIRRAPRVKHRRASRGWESLTPAEAKIAALVAEGMTNPQIAARLFLSHRTVATHVSHILGKLDVRSRIDIAREVTDRRAVAS